jgi:hypothetical protein
VKERVIDEKALAALRSFLSAAYVADEQPVAVVVDGGGAR